MAAVYQCFLVRLLLCLVFNLTLVSSKAIQFDPVTYKEEWWTYQPNPDEMSGKFEGDIILSTDVRGPALKDRTKRWPEGVIYYTLSSSFTVAENLTIHSALDEVSSKTCLRFQVRTNQTDFVYIHKEDFQGCFSHVGRQGGRQTLSIGPGCSSIGVILHELMHIAGFWHEQNRNDRDKYVDIIWPNILSSKVDNFVRYSLNLIDHLGFSYDYGSIMHHSKFAFARDNSKPTMEPLTPGVTIGQREGFSETDIQKINKYYECEKTVTEKYNPCINTEDGELLSHPTLLNKFYQCFQGIAYEFTCPPELLFNPEVSVCDWPYNVQQ